MAPSTTPAGPGGARYVQAAGRPAFTRLYDGVIARTMREERLRGDLVAAVGAALPAGGVVADVGAGTGTFALRMRRARPDATVVAVDGDEDVLRLARAKQGAAEDTWRHGLAQTLPLEDSSVDAVVLSLVLHHLDLRAKRAALAEALRVLRAGGLLHVMDWGRPRDPVMRAAFLALQLVDGFAGTRDHADGRVPDIVREAGFADVRCLGRLRTTWGDLEQLAATRT